MPPDSDIERLELALRGSNVGVWDFDLADGDITTAPVHSVNMWERLGYEDEPPISQWHTNRWHPEDGPKLRAAIADHLGGKTPEFELEMRFRHVDGHYRWHLTRGRAQRHPDGTPFRFLGIAIDLTEKKLLEENLRQAKDTAESANRAKDMFVANVSHEIRTPMNVILGMTEVALAAELTGEPRAAMTAVRSAAETLVVLIDDLLDFAKMEAGKIELAVAPFELRSLIEDTEHAVSVRARHKQLALAFEIGDVPDVVLGDAARLRQVLLNIVDNAVKFTAAGGIRVGIEPETAETIRFTVRDSGIGIAPEIQARIFEAFEQGDASTTKHYGGTGLGLTIAARFVALMGGALEVTSTPGHGSEFAFVAHLPAAASGVVPEPVRPRREKPVPDVAPRGLRVLVAEDDELNQTLMRAFLDGAGHHVWIARDGREALALAETHAFDVLLLDLHLPELDGFAVAEAIRRREAETGSPRLPIIATTARSQRDSQEACIAAGMDSFLGKPLSSAALLAGLAVVVPIPSALVDARTLLASCGDDAHLLQTITNALADQLPAHLATARGLIAENDLASLRELAHRVCGLVAPFSPVLRDIAADLEDAPDTMHLDRLALLGPALVREVQGITIDALRQRASRHDSSSLSTDREM